VVALEGRGHLDAPVAVYAVKLVLVAHLTPLQCTFAPQAGLYGS
jgi:hypothetical protein